MLSRHRSSSEMCSGSIAPKGASLVCSLSGLSSRISMPMPSSSKRWATVLPSSAFASSLGAGGSRRTQWCHSWLRASRLSCVTCLRGKLSPFAKVYSSLWYGGEWQGESLWVPGFRHPRRFFLCHWKYGQWVFFVRHEQRWPVSRWCHRAQSQGESVCAFVSFSEPLPQGQMCHFVLFPVLQRPAEQPRTTVVRCLCSNIYEVLWALWTSANTKCGDCIQKAH